MMGMGMGMGGAACVCCVCEGDQRGFRSNKRDLYVLNRAEQSGKGWGGDLVYYTRYGGWGSFSRTSLPPTPQ